MGLINNILSLFINNSTEMDMMVRKKKTHDVIAEMTAKYGEVTTTVSDIDKIRGEIDKKRKEMVDYDKSVPSGYSRCKSTEDEHRSHKAELETEFDILNELYKKIVIVELNKFPLNKQCTIKYVSNYMGIDNESIIWDILVVRDDGGRINHYMYYGGRYNIDITYISDTKIKISSVMNSNPDSDYYYRHNHDTEKYIHNMILPNWRFVKSVDSSIFYVERMS